MKKAWAFLLSIGLLSAAGLTGCQSKPQAVQQPVQAPEKSIEAVFTPPPLPPVTESSPAPSPSAPATEEGDKVAMVSSEKPPAKTEGTADAAKPKPAANKPKIDIQSPYTESNPTLLGLPLKMSAQEITGKFGKPKEQFVMEEDADPITVYDYTDFLVGFNGQNQLHFVDVRSAEVNPGLNGLKLGDPVADVYTALGKPDANTSYVLTYKATGAILKLDIDPKTQKVNSIKLFADQ